MTLKRRKRILAIDDEPAMTEWLKILLEHAGFEVKTALIGTRGEELFKTWRPDAVVTDMMLPDVDGIELVRKFKQLDPEAEVIVITGQGNIPRSVEAVKAGAFDGATMDKEGLFEMAEGGSLLLDEIGEMPPYLQTKLLRVLQEREYRPIGSDRIVHVDFRLICATNIDLDTALREGKLREDLYFRINTITLRVPPLRERTEDIPLLCDYFLDKFRQRYQKNVKTLAPSVYHLLIRNRWPGNVRELENSIERSGLVAKGCEISVGVLPETIREESASSTDFVIPPHRTLAEIEKMAILQTLQRTNWNKQEAAQILGLYRPTLYSKMKKHEIRDAGKAARAGSAASAPITT